MSEKSPQVRSFQDLKVWKRARRVQRMVAQIVISFPNYEEYRLKDQMIRSSRSIARNIAEGYGRYHYQENIQFCRQSRGSLSELLNDLLTALEEKYIKRNEYDDARNEIENCHKLLNGYIRYLKKAKENYTAEEKDTIYDAFTEPNN
ncbi:MAG: four helix bundle protein [Balneolaceae bacterium]|nr:four helix bundle protein [Balneolaceae bacterium]